jgi:hypothetical protein
MPKCGGSSSKKGTWRGRGWRGSKWIERSGAIAPGDHGPGPEVLHRKTKRVKFDETIVIGGELTHRDKVFYYLGRNKDIVKTERTNVSGAGGSDR